MSLDAKYVADTLDELASDEQEDLDRLCRGQVVQTAANLSLLHRRGLAVFDAVGRVAPTNLGMAVGALYTLKKLKLKGFT